MRLKSRPALERELRSTRAALRRALGAFLYFFCPSVRLWQLHRCAKVSVSVCMFANANASEQV